MVPSTPTTTTKPTTTVTTTPCIPEKPIVRWLGKNHYTVTSRTTPGRIHHIDTYHLTCSCPAGQWGKRCHALLLALQYEAWRRHQEAKARATASTALLAEVA